MKKRTITLLIISLLLIIVPFCLNTYSVLRIISLGIGMFIFVLACTLNDNKNILLIMLLPIVLMVSTLGLDTFLFSRFNRIPIYAFESISSNKVRTLNSLFYRIYDCDGKLTIDYGYQKSYACNKEDIEVIDINEFLENPLHSYSQYKNKFVKLRGKISKITGNESITLSSYKRSEDTLNGYVSFNLNYNVDVLVGEDISKLHIYDYIEVIGLIDKLESKDGKYTIILKDTMLVPSDIYNEYSFEIVTNSEDNLTNLVKEKNYYYYGITSLNVYYDEYNIYELSYLITDNRFSIDSLIKNTPFEIIKDEEEKESGKVYRLDKFNILVCNNDKTIIANKEKELNNDVCLK